MEASRETLASAQSPVAAQIWSSVGNATRVDLALPGAASGTMGGRQALAELRRPMML
jgi:hypothetical protein